MTIVGMTSMHGNRSVGFDIRFGMTRGGMVGVRRMKTGDGSETGRDESIEGLIEVGRRFVRV